MVLGNSERGSVLIFLFMAVALFAALSFAFLRSTRSSVSMMKAEATDAAQIAPLDCANTFSMAQKRLALRGCTTISDRANGSNPDHPDGSCSIFHPNGGGVAPCNGLATAQPCQERLNELAIGEACGAIIYAGTHAGNRLYTTAADTGIGIPWNNGSFAGAHSKVTGATSVDDGLANTATLLAFTGGGQPYQAATMCRALGPEWYLPSIGELRVLRTNQNTGALAGTFDGGNMPPSTYWSSTENTFNRAQGIIMSAGFTHWNWIKPELRRVRCVRR